MDSRYTSLLDKMTESAGELLFEASAHEVPFARSAIKELAHHLGRLYGETIRACREHGGLLDEVQTTFMCGMAISPNFGREEVLRDSGAEAREEETPGQRFYEKQKEGSNDAMAYPRWDELHDDTRLAFEQEAVTRAEAIEREEERAAKAKPDMLRQITDANRTQETAAKPCWKCQGSGNMGFTTYVACDACG